MSDQQLETFLQQMDQDMLMYNQSIQHVNTTPQGEVEIRRIDPRSTMVNGTNTRTLSLYEAGELYYNSTLTEQDIRDFMVALSRPVNNVGQIVYYGTSGVTVSDSLLGDYNYLTTIDNHPIVHKSKYHKYNINEFGIGDKTKFTVKTPTKLFSIETKNKFEYNKALQDAKQGWFKNWNHE